MSQCERYVVYEIVVVCEEKKKNVFVKWNFDTAEYYIYLNVKQLVEQIVARMANNDSSNNNIDNNPNDGNEHTRTHMSQPNNEWKKLIISLFLCIWSKL